MSVLASATVQRVFLGLITRRGCTKDSGHARYLYIRLHLGRPGGPRMRGRLGPAARRLRHVGHCGMRYRCVIAPLHFQVPRLNSSELEPGGGRSGVGTNPLLATVPGLWSESHVPVRGLW